LPEQTPARPSAAFLISVTPPSKRENGQKHDVLLEVRARVEYCPFPELLRASVGTSEMERRCESGG
jgi:hypothetical protein